MQLPLILVSLVASGVLGILWLYARTRRSAPKQHRSLALLLNAVGDRPLQSHTRRVHACFTGVREPRCEFAEEYLGSTIIALDIVAATRRPMSNPRDEACLALELTRSFLVEAERRWETRRLRLFTFERATFRESDS